MPPSNEQPIGTQNTRDTFRSRLDNIQRYGAVAFGRWVVHIIRSVIVCASTRKKTGIHHGRIAIRASGSFNVTTPTGVVRGLSHLHTRLIQRGQGALHPGLKGGIPARKEKKIKIYYAPNTRAVRIVWLFEELGLPYELEHFKLGDAKMRGPST